MTAETSILQNIPNEKPVRIFLPILNNAQRYRTQAVYKEDQSPYFNLLFQAGTLPTEDLDTKEMCLINVDFGNPNISLEATIVSFSNQTLKMLAKNLVSHEQMREFFRVDATTDVISKSFHPEFFGEHGVPWAIQGKTIDISGSGILAVFTEKPPEEEQTRLEISLPTEKPDVAKVLAQPVRSTRVNQNLWEIAYHFVDISIEDRDKIIGCCLEIQRRFLRLRVRLEEIGVS